MPPLPIATVDLDDRNDVRVALKVERGVQVVDIRRFGQLASHCTARMAGSGLSVPVDKIDDVVAALLAAKAARVAA